MSDLDDISPPFWESRISFAQWLEDIAAQVRRGDFRLPVEAVLVTKDMESVELEILTICRYGEPGRAVVGKDFERNRSTLEDNDMTCCRCGESGLGIAMDGRVYCHRGECIDWKLELARHRAGLERNAKGWPKARMA